MIQHRPAIGEADRASSSMAIAEGFKWISRNIRLGQAPRRLTPCSCVVGLSRDGGWSGKTALTIRPRQTPGSRARDERRQRRYCRRTVVTGQQQPDQECSTDATARRPDDELPTRSSSLSVRRRSEASIRRLDYVPVADWKRVLTVNLAGCAIHRLQVRSGQPCH